MDSRATEHREPELVDASRPGRRIGGEFEIDPALLVRPDGPLASLPGGNHYSTGRGVLAAILRSAARVRPCSRVLVPEYICESVVQSVLAVGLQPVFYPVSSALSVDLDCLFSMAREHRDSLAAAVFVDYFGLSECDAWVSAFKSHFPEVVAIRDSVQALFEMERRADEDYRFCSVRKWLPTPDGAWISGGGSPIDVPETGKPSFVADKLMGNLERHWTRDAPPASVDEAYAHLEHGEDLLSVLGVQSVRMSMVSRIMLTHVDLEDVAVRRRENFAVLADIIREQGLAPIFDLPDGRVPHFLPIRIDNRDWVRAQLRAKGIYCPVHWPRPTCLGRPSEGLWADELSLVIDQRYGGEDMARIGEVLANAMSGR